MEKEILSTVVTNGIFCCLFVWLLTETRKDAKFSNERNQIREEKYQSTIANNQEVIKENQNIISKLTNGFLDIKEIKEDVEFIKDKLKGGNY